MPYSSNIGYIGFGKQTTKGTPVVPQTFVKYLSDESGTEIDVERISEGGDGRFANSTTVVKTQHREKVSFSTYVRTDEAANLFAALLGKDTPSSLTTTPFYHTISIATTDQPTTPLQPWLTVQKMLTSTTNSKVQRIQDVKLSSISVEGEAGQPVTMSVEGTGLDGNLITTDATPSYQTGNPLSFYHGIFQINQSTTSNCDIKSFNLTINAENAEDIQTCNLTREDNINLRYAVDIDLTLNYKDYTEMARSNYAAGTSSTEDFSDGSVNIILNRDAATTSEDRVQINVPKVRYMAHTVNLDPAPNVLEQPLTGIGLKQATTDLVTVTVYNTIATTLPL
jgi:hypothetical protein